MPFVLHLLGRRMNRATMTRVLAPGGHLAIATWCQRHSTEETPFTDKEKEDLQFLYDEWAHPYFVSIKDYEDILLEIGDFETVGADDWTTPTIASWRHSIWVGVVDPWIVVFKGPLVWYKTVREIVTLERMHQAFDSGLMEYGMIKGMKKSASGAVPGESKESVSSNVSSTVSWDPAKF